MTDAAAHNDNGKVTLALVGQKLDALTGAVHELATEQRRTAEAVHRLEVWQGQVNEQIRACQLEDTCLQVGVDQAKEKAERAATVANWWNGMNTALALLAGIFGLRQP